MQQGPAERFLFRLSPCVNPLYCLLLLDIPWVFNTPTADTGVIGISPRQINARTWNFRVKGVIQPSICYKVRIPSGVFGVTSLALYASAPNHVFGQMLRLPGSWVCHLTFRSYRLGGQRRTTAIAPWLFWTSTLVEKAEN